MAKHTNKPQKPASQTNPFENVGKPDKEPKISFPPPPASGKDPFGEALERAKKKAPPTSGKSPFSDLGKTSKK